MEELNFEIKKKIGVIRANMGLANWTREINLVSWLGDEPKYDIRDWSPDHTRFGRGITFSKEEADNLLALLLKEREKEKDA